MAVKTNCIKNGVKYYRITVTVGKNAEGKAIRKDFYGKNKSDAEKIRDEYLEGIKKGLKINYDKVTMGETMRSWLFEIVRVSNKIKPSTFERYEGIFRNYIKKSDIYGTKLNAIQSIQLQRYYNELYDKGKSTNVIKNLNKLLKTFFNYAVDEGYLIKNPCAGKKIVIPGEAKARKNIEIFSDEEIIKLREALINHRYRSLILLALGTGLRQGELLALKWDDLNLKEQELVVQRSVKQVYIIKADGSKEYKTIVQTPKSKSSTRIVAIPTPLIKVLEEHKSLQEQEKENAGELYIDENYVFSTELGHIIIARNLTRSYERILKKAEISYKKFHSLRHTYATKLFEENESLKTVQELLGHSEISVTSNTYTHVMPKKKTTAAEKLNKFFED